MLTAAHDGIIRVEHLGTDGRRQNRKLQRPDAVLAVVAVGNQLLLAGENNPLARVAIEQPFAPA